MAERLGLSERGIALILRDLRSSGCIASRREGRRSLYTVVHDKPLLGDDLRNQTVGEFLRRLA